MRQIYACSSNPGKMRDFRLVASELGVTGLALSPLPDLKNIRPPDEVADTFQRNAADKALYYSQFTQQIVMADDSGLEVDALQGAPGVCSARYAGEGATDAENNRLLLENMRGQADRSARFVCALALAQQRRVLSVVTGTVTGEILTAPRGNNGFGYDPLFFHPPFNATFGEVDDATKFTVSHRGTALRQIFQWLELLDRDMPGNG